MITAQEKLRCVERELSYRRRVYARLVARGKMSEPQRVEELRLMEATRSAPLDLRGVIEQYLLERINAQRGYRCGHHGPALGAAHDGCRRVPRP
jgi:hypothetical protein